MFDDLINWSKDNFSNLPWRKKRTLYTTLVSEIMLQQTTVATVLNHYQDFINKYPDLKILAKASEEQLQIDWKGLGYYRRAKNLHLLAQEIVKKKQGQIPLRIEDLKQLPGIGDYTANALIAIGQNKPALPLDANIERVLSRFYGVAAKNKAQLHKNLYQLYQEKKILNQIEQQPRAFFEALMDLGRQICRNLKTECPICPLAKNCIALKERTPLKYPGIIKQKEKFYRLDLVRIIVQSKGMFLAYKKPSGSWLEGQWELPTFTAFSEKKNFTQYPRIKKPKEDLKTYKTSITQFKITNFIYPIKLADFNQLNFPYQCQFVDINNSHNLSTASIKALRAISLI